MFKKYWKWFSFVGALVISFILGTMFVLPLFDDKRGGFVGKTGLQDVLTYVGDPSNESEAYVYWSAPKDSFGIQSMRTVNWSFFKAKFNQHTDWLLQYKRYSYSEWTNGNQYLTVNKSWNESMGFWKINLTFYAPVDVYEARFIFSCDLVVLDYVEKSGYEIWLNYSANATEVYSVMFNWSDLKDIPGLYFNKGVQDDKFFFLFGRQNIPAGVYVFDPIFGNNQANTGIIDGHKRCVSSWFECPTSGTADNISVKVNTWSSYEGNHTCGIYEFLDNDTNYAGDLIGQTEVKVVTTSGWYVFNFSEPKPNLVGGIKYYLACHAQQDVGAGHNFMGIAGGEFFHEYKAFDINMEDPWLGETKHANAYTMAIYCSYTESAVGEEWQQIQDWNLTLSNSSSWVGVQDWNLTLSNVTPVWLSVSDWNITLVNRTLNWQQIQDWNLTLSNVTPVWQQIQEWNLTLSNTSIDEWQPVQEWNLTLSNSNSWNNVQVWNLTLVNLTEVWESVSVWNLTLSNSSRFISIEVWNLTLSNSSIDLIVITGVYPVNNSFNIPLQPWVFATFNSTLGNSLNISWYNDNVLLGVESSVVNGTYSELFIGATGRSTVYVLNVSVDDGDGHWCNETYYFTTEGSVDDRVISTRDSLGIIGLLGGLFGVVLVIVFVKRRKRKDVY